MMNRQISSVPLTVLTFAALVVALSSCTSPLPLQYANSLEADEWYLADGEVHIGDDAMDAARRDLLLDSSEDCYPSEDNYSPTAGRISSGSRLWNRYTGYGYGSNPYYGSNYGGGYGGYGSFGNGYGGFNNGYGGFNNGYGGYNNGYGGFNNGYGGYNNYDPWGNYPGMGWGSGYGGMNNCGNYGTSTTVTTFTGAHPRPSFGTFSGGGGTIDHGGSADDGSADDGPGVTGNTQENTRATEIIRQQREERVERERIRKQLEEREHELREQQQQQKKQRQQPAREQRQQRQISTPATPARGNSGGGTRNSGGTRKSGDTRNSGGSTRSGGGTSRSPRD
jgi:hypothetical protein